MRSVFVEQMMNVNEEKSQIVDFLGSPRRLRRMDENIENVQQIHEHRVIELLQLLLPVKVLWVEPTDLLTLQRSDDGLIVGEVVATREGKW